jgi:hypothetical protein
MIDLEIFFCHLTVKNITHFVQPVQSATLQTHQKAIVEKGLFFLLRVHGSALTFGSSTSTFFQLQRVNRTGLEEER